MSSTKCSQCKDNAWTWMGGQRPFQCTGCGYVYCHGCAKAANMRCPRCSNELKPNGNLPK